MKKDDYNGSRNKFQMLIGVVNSFFMNVLQEDDIYEPNWIQTHNVAGIYVAVKKACRWAMTSMDEQVRNVSS